MSYATPPPRTRPDLYLTLPPPSPSLKSSPYNDSPTSAPFGTTNYSPFRSVGLRPPSPFGSPGLFPPRRLQTGGYIWCRIRRCLNSRVLWFIVTFLGLLLWWGNGGKEDWQKIRDSPNGFGTAIFGSEIIENLQFFPASYPKIHYVGRWTSSPNRLRKDGMFPGVYFDITINSTSTLLLSLRNSAFATASSVTNPIPTATPFGPSHLSFHASPSHIPAPPISLLVRIDQEEYILIPNSTSLVSIRMGDLDPSIPHDVRVIAPMIDDSGKGKLEFEGIWLCKGGELLEVQGSQLWEEDREEDKFEVDTENIEKDYRLGLSNTEADKHEVHNSDGGERQRLIGQRKKVLEIVTDSPGSLRHVSSIARTGGGSGLLGGVMGWDYLLGEMFGADHVGIGVDGMCLIQDCIGGTGQPVGIGDVFFRSGPEGSDYFSHPWLFQAYIPDVMIFNLGSSDQVSFEHYASEYNRSTWEFFENFEDTYISLIKSVRQLAYPKHPAALSAASYRSTYSDSNVPASIPIFVMRPFRGELEHATQAVVGRLRSEGDTFVFWLDTSGWLDTEDIESDSKDFYIDSSASPVRWRLTESGNQRAAIFLHMHICRYLAQDAEKCAFLPPEVYQGKAFDPETANLERFIASEKERKLRALFWEK
ncbi:MAG: hypothetical protein M1840_004595 [Geoglossum simile]|nr:MAG: hypothetical protein M1840_004595 [Geoglossum simile]